MGACLGTCVASCLGTMCGKCMMMGSCPPDFVKRMFSFWQFWVALCYFAWQAMAKPIFYAVWINML